MLPGLNVRSPKEVRLPLLISFEEKEQLLAVPKLDSSSGKAQAKAILDDCNIDDQVQIMRCDTTASNTGSVNGACVLLEQRLEREPLPFACRHYIYELVIESMFEAKIQVTNSPDIPLFKKFSDNWSNIDSTNIQIYLDFVKHYNDCESDQLVMFYNCELQKKIVR